MGDLERKEIFVQILEALDNIDEIVEDSYIETEDDDQFDEIEDLLSRVRTIIAEE